MMKDLIRTGAAQELWETALGELQIQVNRANYRTWFQNTIGIGYEDSQFIIGVPNTFVSEYLERNQRSLIERTLSALTNRSTKVAFQVVTDRQHQPAARFGEHRESIRSGQIELPGFNSRYNFDTFVVGSCNRLAHAAALGVAENLGNSFNPLFIHSAAGLGKTHLLQAIGHIAQAKELQTLYVSTERFTNEFVQAIRQGTTSEFHHKYRTVDVLLVDDIQFLGGKEQTEESFFHTFNELYNANRQIVITSDCPPKALSTLQSRLRSRFECGLTVDIQPPDWETRLAILQAKAKCMGAEIAHEVLEFIAQRSTQNIRELEGSLNRVVAYARLVRAIPTIDIAVQALTNIAGQLPPRATVTPNQLIAAVALSFNLTPADLKGRKRDKITALARQVAMYLIRQETNYSLEKIGNELGGRDHSTVIHACDRIASGIESSSHLKRKIQEIQQEIVSHDRKSQL